MAIQWYPGHMHKAQKEIKEALPKVDLVIEVVDARIPYSSTNPAVASLLLNAPKKLPIIRVLNKTDLADAHLTKAWCSAFESQQQTKALPVSLYQPDQIKKIVGLCHKLLPEHREKGKNINAMIMGIPNVGKSTIINILSGRTIAKTGNEPAVTKRQQRIDIADGITLFDTPGFLWPKIDNNHSSYRLAITGAIKDTVLDYGDIAYFAAEYLIKNYADALKTNYALEEIDNDPIQLLEAIGLKRGCLAGGGRVDFDRVCKIFIHEFRNHSLGSITLESPEMIEKELVEVEEQLQIKAEKAAQRKNKKKKRRR